MVCWIANIFRYKTNLQFVSFPLFSHSTPQTGHPCVGKALGHMSFNTLHPPTWSISFSRPHNRQIHKLKPRDRIHEKNKIMGHLVVRFEEFNIQIRRGSASLCEISDQVSNCGYLADCTLNPWPQLALNLSIVIPSTQFLKHAVGERKKHAPKTVNPL